jgi:hypothetical protein
MWAIIEPKNTFKTNAIMELDPKFFITIEETTGNERLTYVGWVLHGVHNCVGESELMLKLEGCEVTFFPNYERPIL